jgi:hypothetical protein
LILPVRIALGFGLCVLSIQADIIAGGSCFPSGGPVLSSNSCDLNLPGTPSPGSIHASYSYQLPAASGFAISASVFSSASVLTTQVVTFPASSMSHVSMSFMYDSPGPYRPGLALVELHTDGDFSRNPNGGGDAIVSFFQASWGGGQCVGCFPAGYVPFFLGSPFPLAVDAFAYAPLSTGPGTVSSFGSASVSFQLFEQDASGQPGAAVEAFQLPEPGSFGMIALGIACLLLYCARRRGTGLTSHRAIFR